MESILLQTVPKYLIKNVNKIKALQIPRDFKEFLRNGSNTNRMVEIIFGVITDEKEDVCSKLRSNEIYLSSEGYRLYIIILTILLLS